MESSDFAAQLQAKFNSQPSEEDTDKHDSSDLNTRDQILHTVTSALRSYWHQVGTALSEQQQQELVLTPETQISTLDFDSLGLVDLAVRLEQDVDLNTSEALALLNSSDTTIQNLADSADNA